MPKIEGDVYDRAESIGVEHTLWAKGQGHHPYQVLLSVGEWNGILQPDWNDAAVGVSRAWLKMRAIDGL